MEFRDNHFELFRDSPDTPAADRECKRIALAAIEACRNNDWKGLHNLAVEFYGLYERFPDTGVFDTESRTNMASIVYNACSPDIGNIVYDWFRWWPMENELSENLVKIAELGGFPAKHDVIITVEGGCVDVMECPDNIRVIIRDYDIEGYDMEYDDDEMGVDEDGDEYREMIF